MFIVYLVGLKIEVEVEGKYCYLICFRTLQLQIAKYELLKLLILINKFASATRTENRAISRAVLNTQLDLKSALCISNIYN